MNRQVAGKATDKQGHFKGVAVVIDDEISDAQSAISEIIKSIRDGGGHPVTLSALPDDLTNFANVAFFIMDWNLNDADLKALGPGTSATSKLKEENVRSNLRFIKSVARVRHAPLFIFTADSTEEVLDALTSDEELNYVEGQSHILVKHKNDVKADVYAVLNDWADQVPSVIALKAWERELHEAVNSMFVDFHNRSPMWPLMFWQAAKTDGIPEEAQLTNLITRLVVSRIKPMTADFSRFEAQMTDWAEDHASDYLQDMLKVLEGERMVAETFLAPKDIAPGDFFEVEGPKGERQFLLNIRSECDCARGNPELYLVRGKIVDSIGEKLNPTIGNIDSHEKHGEAIVAFMYDKLSISFSFRKLEIEKWNNLKGARRGRLLAPFLTRVTQRYAAYSNRPGLPRLPGALVNYLVARDAKAADPQAGQDRTCPDDSCNTQSVAATSGSAAGVG